MNTIEVRNDCEISVQNEELDTEYIKDLFDDEGPFGEADCAGL